MHTQHASHGRQEYSTDGQQVHAVLETNITFKLELVCFFKTNSSKSITALEDFLNAIVMKMMKTCGDSFIYFFMTTGELPLLNLLWQKQVIFSPNSVQEKFTRFLLLTQKNMTLNFWGNYQLSEAQSLHYSALKACVLCTCSSYFLTLYLGFVGDQYLNRISSYQSLCSSRNKYHIMDWVELQKLIYSEHFKLWTHWKSSHCLVRVIFMETQQLTQKCSYILYKISYYIIQIENFRSAIN